jgi:hypothetical protein
VAVWVFAVLDQKCKYRGSGDEALLEMRKDERANTDRVDRLPRLPWAAEFKLTSLSTCERMSGKHTTESVSVSERLGSE